jgi:hypothetical protein
MGLYAEGQGGAPAPVAVAPSDVHVAISHCGRNPGGERELVTLIKSVLMSTHPEERVHFHLVMDKSVRPKVREWVEALGPSLAPHASIHIIGAEYADAGTSLFKLCSLERVSLAKYVDAPCVVYLDRNTLVLQFSPSAVPRVTVSWMRRVWCTSIGIPSSCGAWGC